MKTVIIHGQAHKGSTAHIAQMTAQKLGGEVKEFFLPKDFDKFCVGCCQCFADEEKCPHRSEVVKITRELDEADVIILASPVYVYHVTGAMKAFLDHLGFRWMAHRPVGAMFKKQGVCITTAAGAGCKSTLKDMADSLFFWGVGRIYSFGIPVAAASWEQISEKKLAKIERATDKLAARIKTSHGRVVPSLKTKGMFMIMRMMHKKVMNPPDTEYWKKQGWLESQRPWK